MRAILLLLPVVLAGFILLATPGKVVAQGDGSIAIIHTPPTDAIPGRQISIHAVFVNATSAGILWRNSTMTLDEAAPLTNQSVAEGAGWRFAAFLPAQGAPTQIRYSINATGPSGFLVESYFFSVSEPAAGGITPSGQTGWILTIASSVAMVSSIVAVMYWYVGRRLRREG